MSVILIGNQLLAVAAHYHILYVGWARFAKKIFSLVSEIKRIWIRFTCVSLFHYKIFTSLFSLLFASNFSLRFTWVIFSLFFVFFALNFSLLRSETKRSEIQVYFLVFFTFFLLLFSLFFTFFRFIFVSLRFFHFIFAYFTFVFASDFWCFASKWIMWNQAFFFASKRNEIFASILNFASEAKVRAHPTCMSAILIGNQFLVFVAHYHIRYVSHLHR